MFFPKTLSDKLTVSLPNDFLLNCILKIDWGKHKEDLFL